MLSTRTCGVCVSLHILGFIDRETRVMPGTDRLRTWGILVMYPSLARDLDPTVGMPGTGWRCNLDSGFKQINQYPRD